MIVQVLGLLAMVLGVPAGILLGYWSADWMERRAKRRRRG